MSELSRNDIRRLLKTFGIQADGAITAHLARNSGDDPSQIRLRISRTRILAPRGAVVCRG